MQTKEWTQLSAGARDTYLCLRMQPFLEHRRRAVKGFSHIPFSPRHYWGEKKDAKTFHRRIKELIDSGFIRVVEKGQLGNRSNVYAITAVNGVLR